MFYTQSTVHGPQSAFYTDRFLIILVMLIILVIQVITIFFEISIAPYQCCQSYLKSSKIRSKVTIKISSRGTICFMNDNLLQSAFHSGNSTKTALIRNYHGKILFKMDNYELKGLVFVDFRQLST